MKSLNNTLSNILPDRHCTKTVRTGKKLGSFFSTKDETKKNNMTLFTTLSVLKVHVVRTTLVKLQDGYRKE